MADDHPSFVEYLKFGELLGSLKPNGVRSRDEAICLRQVQLQCSRVIWLLSGVRMVWSGFFALAITILFVQSTP